VASESENALSLSLENGSRVIVVPAVGATVRGYSAAALIIIDEAAQVDDSLYATLRPMLAVSGGRLVLASTPFGRRGFFFEAWRSEEPWERYKVKATDVPRIPAEFLAEEERNIGEWWFQQEYCCEFLDATTAAFREQDIESAFSLEVQPWSL
jgi:hypothetical protein